MLFTGKALKERPHQDRPSEKTEKQFTAGTVMRERIRFQILQLAFAFGFCLANAAAASDASRCSTLIAHVQTLVERSWVDDKFSTPFLRELAPLSDSRLKAEFGFEPRRVHQAARGFRHRSPNCEPLAIEHFLAERLPAQQLVVLFVMKTRGEVAGFLALSLEKKETAREAWSEYLKVDRDLAETRGISVSFLEFSSKFYSTLGVTTERLEAGWSGRPLWARAGYEFDPQALLWENGVPYPQVEVIRRNFERFLRFHGINSRELYLHKLEGVPEPLSALTDLKTPADFLAVKHSAGPFVGVAPYIDVDTLGPAFMAHPGLAFSLWDYRPRPNQTTSIGQNGKPLSDIAMPTWIGMRNFESQ